MSWLLRIGLTILIALSIFAFGFVKGCSHEQAKAKVAEATVVVKAAKTNETQRVESAKVENDYVSKVESVGSVAPSTVADFRADACRVRTKDDDRLQMPASGIGKRIDVASAPDSNDGSFDRLVNEIPAAVKNKVQLTDLQRLICANTEGAETHPRCLELR